MPLLNIFKLKKVDGNLELLTDIFLRASNRKYLRVFKKEADNFICSGSNAKNDPFRKM